MKHLIRGLLMFALVWCAEFSAAAATPVPNAWRISDFSDLGGSTLFYLTNLPTSQRIAATNVGGGFKLSLRGRFTDTSFDSRTMMMIYGMGSRRYLVAWETNGVGNLVAHVEGGQIYTLTTNGGGSRSYHTHEIIYNPATGTASYVVDGQVKTNNLPPSNVAWPAGQISWGASFSSGRGTMHFNRVTFEITNVVATEYYAGTEGSPPAAPNPVEQGWTLDYGSGSFTSLSPDTGVRPVVVTQDPAGATTSSVVASGLARGGSWPTLAWIEWGTNLTYGGMSSVQAVQGLTNNFMNLTLNGLVPGVDYRYRMAASNEFGIFYGLDYPFNLDFRPVATDLPGLENGSAAWADYDRDGLLDVLVMGYETGSGYVSQLWRNTGSSFVNVPIAGLPGLAEGSVTWADYDNDGRPDFLISGWTGSFPYTELWRNTGSTFVLVSVPGLGSVYRSSVAWADYDNDGRQDFLVTGLNGSVRSSLLYRNTGTNFTLVPVPGLPGVDRGSIGWADYDKDGDADLLITGESSTGLVSQLWQNTGASFTNVPLPGVPPVEISSAAWADYDSDGKIDFLLSGFSSTGSVWQLWRNTGSSFTNVPVEPWTNSSIHSIAGADYDGNGRPDFLFTRQTGGSYALLWRNMASGFVDAEPALLRDFYFSSGTWADYDNDGRIDFLISGYVPSTGTSELWRSYLPQTNTPPSAPSGLYVTPSGLRGVLNWSSAFDLQTPAAALTYNVRVGTVPGGGDVISSLALSNGFRLVPQHGNAEQRLHASIPVQVGQTYYWSVQTIDGALAGSPFATEQSFTMNTVLTPPDGIPVIGDANGNGVVDFNELNGVLDNYNGGVIDQATLDEILERYWPNSPWLEMINVAGLGGTNVTFALTNSLAGAFTVEYSTNLLDWAVIGPAIPRYGYTDTNAPGPQRYYRLRWP